MDRKNGTTKTHRMTLSKMSILGILTVLLLLNGCALTEEQTDNSQYNVGQGIEEAQEELQKYIQEKKASLQAEFERMYGDDVIGLDLSATEKRLTDEFCTAYEQDIDRETQFESVFKCKVDFYRDSLKEAQEKNWDIATILQNPKKHIRSIALEAYGFTNPDTNSEQCSFFENSMFQKSAFDGSIQEIEQDNRYFVYPSSVLKTYTLDQIRNFEHPFVQLNGVSEYIVSSGVMSEKEIPEVKEIKAKLKEKYNEEFECIQMDKLYCPVREPDLVFESSCLLGEEKESYVKDLYLPVLAQKKMSEEINKMIDEEGASDWLLQYTRVENFLLSDSEIYKSPWDTGNLTDLKEFLRNGYKDNYEIGLICLVDESGVYDREVVNRIEKRINELLDFTYNEKNMIKVTSEVSVYKVRQKDKAILRDLFRQSPYLDYRFARDGSLSAAYASMSQVRGDTEGFRYLDAYGEQLN